MPGGSPDAGRLTRCADGSAPTKDNDDVPEHLAPAVPEGAVATARSVRGEVVLRRRPWDAALELRVNGVFVMDDRHTSTERALAQVALRAIGDRPRVRVLIGGLGLGHTLHELLTCPRTTAVTVAEIEPALVGWHRDGLVPGSPLSDPRVTVAVADVADVVSAAPPGTWDSILLDVDNGPDFLVHQGNALFYRRPFLRACHEALGSSGVFAVWSCSPSPDLASGLEEVFDACERHSLPVTLGTRDTAYHVFVARRLPRQPEPPEKIGSQGTP
jgi:spermidine synthase